MSSFKIISFSPDVSTVLLSNAEARLTPSSSRIMGLSSPSVWNGSHLSVCTLNQQDFYIIRLGRPLENRFLVLLHK